MPDGIAPFPFSHKEHIYKCNTNGSVSATKSSCIHKNMGMLLYETSPCSIQQHPHVLAKEVVYPFKHDIGYSVCNLSLFVH